MAEIKKVKASTLPDITDLTGYKVFGVKKNIDETVDNGLISISLITASVTEEIGEELVLGTKSETVTDVTDYNEVTI